jgi:hypothetical protein
MDDARACTDLDEHSAVCFLERLHVYMDRL